MKNLLYRYFSIQKYNTSIRTEIFAGISTYLSLAYIFVVNPAILNKAGLDLSAVLFATAVASGITTIVMGLWARLPFVVAPGLEMNGFFAFVAVGVIHLTWQQALGAVFWSGVLCVVFTIIPARQKIISSIPDGLKANIAVSVGFFVAAIGLSLSGIIVFEEGVPSHFGSFTSPKALSMYIGLIISVLLGIKRLKFAGGMLVAIIVAAVFCKFNGIEVKTPAKISSHMLDAFAQLDWLVIFKDIRVLPVLVVFFVIDYYGSIGKFIGLTKSTNLVDKDGNLPNMVKALYVDGGGTIGGALLGTSSLITYVESAVGIAAGGRTGIVAIVCGILMLCSIVFTPLIGLIPVEATSGVLLYVAWLLLPFNQPPTLSGETAFASWKRQLDKIDFVTALFMATLSLVTFSLDKAMLAGFLIYTLKSLFYKGHHNWYLTASTILLIISVASQYIYRA